MKQLVERRTLASKYVKAIHYLFVQDNECTSKPREPNMDLNEESDGIDLVVLSSDDHRRAAIPVDRIDVNSRIQEKPFDYIPVQIFVR